MRTHKLSLSLTVMLATIAVTPAAAQGWRAQRSVDAMTDQATTTVSLTSKEGHTFTIIRKSDARVWGYLRLAGLNQFRVGERLLLRVDKTEPVEYSESDEKFYKDLGMNIKMWEWNPSLIGFVVWHGKADEGCGLVKRLYEGRSMVIRYHPNESTFVDVNFALNQGQRLLLSSLGLNINDCKE